MNAVVPGSTCPQPGMSCRLSTPIAGRAAALQSQGKQSARVLHTPTMKGDTQGMRQSPYRKQEGHDNFPSRQCRSSWQLCGGRCSCKQQSQSDGSWAPQRSRHSRPSTGLSCSSLCRARCCQSCGGLALSAPPLPGMSLPPPVQPPGSQAGLNPGKAMPWCGEPAKNQLPHISSQEIARSSFIPHQGHSVLCNPSLANPHLTNPLAQSLAALGAAFTPCRPQQTQFSALIPLGRP